MKQNARTAYNALQKIGAPVFMKDGEYAHFFISAEHNSTETWADYYDGATLEHVDENGKIVWRFGVNPLITDILDENGLFDEWVNPGYLGVYDA